MIKSFNDAWRGLLTVFREEHNFKIEICCAILALMIGTVLRLTNAEWGALFAAIIFVIGGEIVNTAIEDLCDKVEPAHDAVIGKIKDMMAAFVLVCAIGALAIGCIVFLHHI